MRDGEFSERIVSPEVSRRWLSDDMLQIPRGFEGSGDDLLIGVHCRLLSSVHGRWETLLVKEKS